LTIDNFFAELRPEAPRHSVASAKVVPPPLIRPGSGSPVRYPGLPRTPIAPGAAAETLTNRCQRIGVPACSPRSPEPYPASCGVAPFRPGHDHIAFAAPASGTDQPIAPIENRDGASRKLRAYRSGPDVRGRAAGDQPRLFACPPWSTDPPPGWEPARGRAVLAGG
jgi:hypothetical protein